MGVLSAKALREENSVFTSASAFCFQTLAFRFAVIAGISQKAPGQALFRKNADRNTVPIAALINNRRSRLNDLIPKLIVKRFDLGVHIVEILNGRHIFL